MFNIPGSLVLCGGNDPCAPKETFGRQTSPALCCYFKNVFTLLICVCSCAMVFFGCQRETDRNWFSVSILWAPKIKLCSSGLAVST